MNEDNKLIQDSLSGDCRSFEKLVEKYQSTICAITFSATGRLETSEELAQETFFRAWKNLAQLKDINKFRFWLCSIARHLILTYYQQKHSDKVSVCDTDTLETLSMQQMQSPADTLISREEEMILSQALMQIPEEYREPLVLYYRQEQSTKEVAESLDLNEATVRTRLSRGRQMLKDQVAAMVERTLEKTGPTKKFTKAVMVSIGAGLAATTAATADMAAAGAATGVSTATTGILTATVAKVTAIAAVVILTAGVAIYSYSNSQKNTPVTQPTQQESILETNSQTHLPSPVPVVKDEIKPEPVTEQAPIQPVAGKNQSQTPSAKPQVRHPDWPGIGEPVKYVYVHEKTIYQDKREAVSKIWFRIPDGFRYESDGGNTIIDNGHQRLVLDPNTKQAQLEPTWFADGYFYLYGTPQPLSKHPAFPPIELFQNSEPSSDIELTKLTKESDAVSDVYLLKDKSSTEPNAVTVKLWTDKRSGLPEKMEGIHVQPLHDNDDRAKTIITYDYKSFPDTLFSTDIPADYRSLLTKRQKVFSGRVIDLIGRPVAGTEVYIYFSDRPDKTPLQGTTDQNGDFYIPLRGEQFAHSSIVLWAKLSANPDFIGWTFLLSPADREKMENEQKRGFGLGGTIPGSPGIIYPSEDYVYEKTEKSNTYRGSWCVGASDIVLVMEPANTVFGWVQDMQGNPVSGATIAVRLGKLANQHGYESVIGLWNKHPNDLFTSQTNEQGYYEIGFIPKLWKDCSLSIQASPDADCSLVGDSKRMDIVDPNQPIQADFVLLTQGPMVRGIVVDNYGTPLPGRTVSVLVNGKYFPGYAANTDKDGRFEFKHCPADMGLEIRATLSSIIYNYNGKETGQEYYPDVTVHVGYQPGQDEYEVKLVAIKPEIEIEAILTDSAGNPLPYFPVEIRSDESISTEWLVYRKLKGRTDTNGGIKLVNVPEMKGLRLVCSYCLSNNIMDSEQPTEMQEYFKQLEKNNKHHWTEALVPLEPGKKKYQMTITIPTEEEYKQQKREK